jgi:beta-glucosidase/6-phospho-beta-glucosidase/beta-galactosidase
MDSHTWAKYTDLFRQERLKFWSDPDTELKLAKETGISVFRLGIDWTRVMPKAPTEESKSSVSLRNLLCTSCAFSEHLYTFFSV